MDTATSKPLIQIDNEIREMTADEYENYLKRQENATKKLGTADDAEQPA